MKNKILIMGISGMGIFVLMHLILIFAKAPHTTPRALIFGYIFTATITLVGVIMGMSSISKNGGQKNGISTEENKNEQKS